MRLLLFWLIWRSRRVRASTFSFFFFLFLSLLGLVVPLIAGMPPDGFEFSVFDKRKSEKWKAYFFSYTNIYVTDLKSVHSGLVSTRSHLKVKPSLLIYIHTGGPLKVTGLSILGSGCPVSYQAVAIAPTKKPHNSPYTLPFLLILPSIPI